MHWIDQIPLLALLIQVGLPLLVGLVTKASWSPGWKATLLLALTAVNQYLVTWLGAIDKHQAFDWKGYLVTVIIGFVISVGSHFGLLKPTGATEAVQNTLVKD
jgi:hypothetical protein